MYAIVQSLTQTSFRTLTSLHKELLESPQGNHAQIHRPRKPMIFYYISIILSFEITYKLHINWVIYV